MDPKVCGKLLTHHRRGYGVDVEALHDRCPSGGAPEQAPIWVLVDTESYGGGIRVLAPYLIVCGYVGIYRRKEYVRGATWGSRGWRAGPSLVGAPLSPGPREQPPTYFFLLYIPTYPENIQGATEK